MRFGVRRGRWWLIGTALVLAVVAGSGGWLLLRGDGGAAASAATTAQVTTTTVKQTASASGTVEPAKTADLDFAVSGTVTHVYVAEGDHVAVGQRLARVDDAALRAALTAAQSTLTAAEEQRSQDESDGASDVQLAADGTAVVAAQASLQQAQAAVDDAVLRSTIAGTVTSVDLAVGDVVGSSGGSGGSGGAGGSGSTGSSAAVTVVSTGAYVVEATVASADVGQVKRGLQAEISVTGMSETVYGTVLSVGLVAQTNDSGAAVFPVTIAVTGRREDLYAGTSATASIIVKQTPDVLVVPSRALRTDGDTTYVLKVEGGGTVRTTVTIGEVYGAETAVESGLAEGDTVQVPGFTRLAGGSGSQRQGGFQGGFPGGFGGGQGTFVGPGGGQGTFNAPGGGR